MSLRTGLLGVFAKTDPILGPDQLDFRATQVRIVLRSWSGGHRGAGTPRDASPTTLPNYIRVRRITDRLVSGSGGLYEDGDVMVGPIRPLFTNADGSINHAYIGFTEQQLNPTITEEGTELLYVLSKTDPAGTGFAGEYALVDFQVDRSSNFKAVVRLRRQ